MYLIGSIDQVNAYNEKVKSGENYTGRTQNWDKPRRHPLDNIYAVKKHPKYEGPEMELTERLSEDWIPTLNL